MQIILKNSFQIYSFKIDLSVFKIKRLGLDWERNPENDFFSY